MDRGGGLTELVIDPVLKDADKDSAGGQNAFLTGSSLNSSSP